MIIAAASAKKALEGRARQLLWAGAILAVLVPALGLAYLALSWRDIESTTLARQGLYSRVLEGQTHGAFDSVGATLRICADSLELPMAEVDPVQAGRLLVDSIAAQPMLRSLSLLDEQGIVLASTHLGSVGLQIDLSVLGGMPQDRADHIGPLLPLRDLSQLQSRDQQPAGLAAIPVLRRVVRNGQAPLVLVALLNPDLLATQREVMIGSDASHSALFAYDGQLLSGGSGVPLVPGRRYAQLAPFAHFLPAREHAIYVEPGMLGEPAIGAFRTLRSWPLVVVSEQPYAEIWSELADRARWVVLACLLAWAGVGMGGAFLRKGVRNALAAQDLVASLHEKVILSEERWKLALEGAGDGVWDWNIVTGEAHYSLRCKVMLGYAEADLGNHFKAWLELVHPLDSQRFKEDIDAHLRGQTTLLHSELRMRCKTGEWKWLLMRGTVTPARDAAHKPMRMTGTMTDITERRAADAALAASQARRLAVLQSSIDAIVTVDHSGRVMDFNPAAEAMFGRTQDEAVGMPMHRLVPAELLGRANGGAGKARGASGLAVLNRRVEVLALRADGTPFTVELTVVPVVSGGEELFTATLRDITERRRVERALRDSEARARATFEQAAVGVFQEGVDRRFLRVNQTLCKLLGYSASEFLELNADQIIHPEDASQDREELRRLFAGEIASLSKEKRYRRKDGRHVWVRLTASVAHDDDGQALYLIGVVEDIGVQRRAQEDLLAARRRELEIGARIQQSLLVTAPAQALPGVWLSSYNHASQQIDGDFFEVIRPGPQCIDLIAGDVMGKGVNAALMGAAVKMQFSRSLVELLTEPHRAGTPPAPREILAAVHRAVTPHLQALDAFVTLSYIRIDLRSRRLRWVGCGHEEAVLLRADGSRALLGNQQPPLGVLDGLEFAEDEFDIRAGDALLMHSDGVTDAFHVDGERVGHQRLHDAFARQAHAHATPAAALHMLRRELLASATLPDDVTMVMARICDADAPITRVELAAEAASVAPLRAFVTRQCAAAGLEGAEAGLFTVAVVEAFTNIFRHGQGLLPEAPVEVVAELAPGSLRFDLVYLGESFTPPDEPTHTSFDEYPEGGFGLTIIRKACDAVEYLHHEGVNTVRLMRWTRADAPAYVVDTEFSFPSQPLGLLRVQ